MLVETGPQSVRDELLAFAEMAEDYVNEPASDEVATEKLKEAVHVLDHEAITIGLIGQQVSLCGHHIKAQPRQVDGEPLGSIEISASYGIVQGTYKGFEVIDFKQYRKLLSASAEEDELDVLEQMGEKMIGRYAVCHLVDSDSYLDQSVPNNLVTFFAQYRAVGPITSSLIIAETDYGSDIAIHPSYRAMEVRRIIDSLPASQRSLVRHIETIIEAYGPENELEGLISSGRKLRGVLSDCDEVAQKAILESLINDKAAASLGERYYLPNGIPLGLILNGTEDGLMSGSVNSGLYARVVDVIPLPLYEQEDESVVETHESAAYLVVSFPNDQFEGGECYMGVPLELLDDDQFRPIPVKDYSQND